MIYLKASVKESRSVGWETLVSTIEWAAKKYSPGVNFINVLHGHFLYKIFDAKTSNPNYSFVIFGAKILYEKCACTSLMKLTAFVPVWVAN